MAREFISSGIKITVDVVGVYDRDISLLAHKGLSTNFHASFSLDEV